MRLPALALFCAALLLLVTLPASAQGPAGDLHYERVGKLIYGVARLESETGTAPAIQGRIAALALERDAIVKVAGRVADAQLDAALRELQAINDDLAK